MPLTSVVSALNMKKQSFNKTECLHIYIYLSSDSEYVMLEDACKIMS